MDRRDVSCAGRNRPTFRVRQIRFLVHWASVCSSGARAFKSILLSAFYIELNEVGPLNRRLLAVGIRRDSFDLNESFSWI